MDEKIIREEYQKKMELKLKEWENKIESFKIKTEKLNTEAKIKINEKIKNLKEKTEKTKKNLKYMKEAAAGSWQPIKKRLDETAEKAEAKIAEIVKRLKS